MNVRGPKNPDDFRVEVRRSRHYWDPLPACDLRPEGPMIEKQRTKVALPAQSSIMKAIPADALLYWATGKVAEYAVDERAKWEKLDRDDAVELLKKAHRKASSKAADRGTGIHEYIEAKLEGSTVDLTYLDDGALPYLPIVDQFFAEQEPELVLAEVVGIGEHHGVTTDAVLRLPKLEVDLAVVDWKSRNDTVKKPHVVYEKEVAQLGANLDLRYWIVEDVETDEARRIALPDGMKPVLVTFTTTSYAVHLVDRDEAVAGFRDVYAWWQAMKRLPKAAKGVKVYELAGSVSPSPVEEAPAEPEIVETPETANEDPIPTVSDETVPEVPVDVDELRRRIVRIVEGGNSGTLEDLWPTGVPGLSDADPDEYRSIEKAVERAEAKLGLPFDPPPSEPPPSRFAKPDVEPPPVVAPKPDEGPDVPDEDVETVRKAFGFLSTEGFDWIAAVVGRAGNLSMSEKPSARRARIGWSLVRLATAGWHDDELLAACLDHAEVSTGLVDDPAPVLAALSATHAGRLSETVGELVEDRLTFTVPESGGGRVRLVAA